MTPADLPANMTSKITEDERGCWIWTGARTGNGYGSVGIDGRQHSTHRRAYTLLIGPVPDGLVLDHAVCGVKACCNPLVVAVIVALALADLWERAASVLT